MFERQGGALDRDQGQDCGDNSAMHLDDSRRRRHCGIRIEMILARNISPAVFAGARAAPNPNKGMFQMTADVAETGVAAQELTQFVERVERLEEEPQTIAAKPWDLDIIPFAVEVILDDVDGCEYIAGGLDAGGIRRPSECARTIF